MSASLNSVGQDASSSATASTSVHVKHEQDSDSSESGSGSGSGSGAGKGSGNSKSADSEVPFLLVPTGCIIRLPAAVTRPWARALDSSVLAAREQHQVHALRCVSCGGALADLADEQRACARGVCAQCCQTAALRARSGGGGGGEAWRPCLVHDQFERPLRVHERATALSFNGFALDERCRLCPCGAPVGITPATLQTHVEMCEFWRSAKYTPEMPVAPYHPDLPMTQADVFKRVFGTAGKYKPTDREWRALLNDFDRYPPLRLLLQQNDASFIAEQLNAEEVRLYLERHDVRAGHTANERRRQLIAVAAALDSIGAALWARTQPRWTCCCSQRFESESQLLRHAAICVGWLPLYPLPPLPPDPRLGIRKRSQRSEVPANLPRMHGLQNSDLLCGARRPARAAASLPTLEHAVEGARAIAAYQLSSAFSQRLCTLQALYLVPLRSALMHLAAISFDEDLPFDRRQQLAAMRSRMTHIYELVRNPELRFDSTIAEIDETERLARYWLAVFLREKELKDGIVENVSNSLF